MVKKVEYSLWVGLGKSVKNVVVTVGVPALAVLLNNYVDWLPKEYYPYAVPIISIIAYAVKNYVKNK